MVICANRLGLAAAIAFSGIALGQPSPRRCGYERWPVKVLVDKDREKIDPSPIKTTITQLDAIPIHAIPYPYDRRIAPEELRVYRIKARLLRVRRERDSDIHLLLADPDDPSKRMIAEIPAPECALGSGHEEEYRIARQVVSTLRTNDMVEIVGVGFFDFLHSQKGAAKNGIELHPVLSIKSFRIEDQQE